jgi:hypothetical protein
MYIRLLLTHIYNCQSLFNSLYCETPKYCTRVCDIFVKLRRTMMKYNDNDLFDIVLDDN